MTRLRFIYSTLITTDSPVSSHGFALRCVPMRCPSQKVLWEQVSVIPSVPLSRSRDAFGNELLTGYAPMRHDFFAYESAGLVESSPSPDTTPDSIYLYPTPLTAPDDNLRRLACSLDSSSPSAIRSSITSLLYDNMHYERGFTNINTTAAAAWNGRVGVCQDFAHIAVALLRLAGFHARYVCGLMIGHGESHAWVEMFDSDKWIAFDPTNGKTTTDVGYIKFAHGRDFDDCSMCRGSFSGCASQSMRVSVEVWNEQRL
jgi:transglutaminase-like putative cysteine protease